MKKVLLYLFVALMMVSCNQVPSAEKVKELESQLVNEDGTLNVEVGSELIDAYLCRAENNPQASTSPEEIFKALDISVNLNFANPQKTIAIADILIDKYPDYSLTPMAMFLKGFVYENIIGDLQSAETVYHQFIDKYPDNPMVEDVKVTVENMGLSPEELIRKFESKNEAAE